LFEGVYINSLKRVSGRCKLIMILYRRHQALNNRVTTLEVNKVRVIYESRWHHEHFVLEFIDFFIYKEEIWKEFI